MKYSLITSKKEREKIFSLFIKNKRLKFSEIEKKIEIKSNHLNYYINKMIKEDLIEKVDKSYQLTKEAEKLIPFFAHITGKEQGPLCIITAAILNNNKICLLKREKRPYQGYWGMIGGKLKLAESIKDTALREAKEETNLNCKFEKLSAVLHERVKDKDNVKHAFVIFLCKLTTKQDIFKVTEEGELKWFNLNKLPKKIIPSDKLMIKELIENEFCCKNIIINEKEGKLKNMEIKDEDKL